MRDNSDAQTGRSVKKLLEYTDLEVKNIVKCIKAAKETENIIHGLVSNSTDFRSAKDEIFLCDTGATVSIIGLQVAKENGGTLDIVV